MGKFSFSDTFVYNENTSTVFASCDSCKLDTDKYLIFFVDNSDTYKAKARVAEKISTGATDEIVYGDVVEIEAGESSSVSCCQLDTDKALLAWTDWTDSKKCKAMWVSVSDRTITTKTVVDIFTDGADTEEVYEKSLCQLDTDKALLLMTIEEDTSNDAECKIVAIEPNGSSLTQGALVSLRSDDVSQAANRTSSAHVDTDKAVVSYVRNASVYCHLITASGLVLTDVDDDSIAQTNYPSLCTLTTTSVFIGYRDTGENDTRGRIINLSANTIDYKTDVQATTLVGSCRVATLSSTIAVMLVSNSVEYAISFIPVAISGDIVSFGTVENYTESGYTTTFCLDYISVSKNDYKIIVFYNSDVYAGTGIIAMFRSIPTATGYCGAAGVTEKLRLVSTADAEYSSLRIRNGGTTHAADLVTVDPVFNNYAVRIQHPIHGILAWRDASAE